jgi:hypothetical protein
MKQHFLSQQFVNQGYLVKEVQKSNSHKIHKRKNVDVTRFHISEPQNLRKVPKPLELDF